jgi:flagellar hook-associated protein 1
MSGLTASLSIGVQALQVAQSALSVTSNNIANADTAGYTREVVQTSENPLSFENTRVLGGGVSLDGVQSVRDELLNLQIAAQTSQQSSAETQYASLEQLQTYFTTTGGDITTALSNFSSALAQLSANPSSSAVQAGVVSSGQNLANAFNNTAAGLSDAQANSDSQVTQTVAEINSLTQQIAALNGQVATLQAAGKDGGTAQDQRDELVQQLSKLTGISVIQSNDGETITTGDGSPLVVGSQSFSLQTTKGSDGMQHVIDTTGKDITTSIQGGTLGGAIAIRDQVIPGFISQLNTLASQFATAFNSAQASGYDSNGNAGQDFFTFSASGAASTLAVASTDPSLIAISSDGSSGSSGNVTNLANAVSGALPSGLTPAQAYATLVQQVGTATSNASAQSTAIGNSLLQLTNMQGSVSGVSIDEETTNLIRYQTAYQAAARIVSTIQKLNDTTINMIS